MLPTTPYTIQSSLDAAHAQTELLENFAQWLKNNHIAVLTMASYQRSVRFFCQFLSLYHEKEIGIDDIIHVTMTDIRAFLAHRSGENIGNSSNAQSLSALKTFYRFLVERGHTLSWDLQKLRRPRLPRTFPRPLDTDQLKPLLTPPLDPHSDWVEWRNYSLIVVLYATGLRIQEVLNINHQYWGKPDGVRVLCKGGKERLVPILPIAQNAVDAYLGKSPFLDRHPETPVFLGEKGKRLQAGIVQKSLRLLRTTYNLPDHTTPHSFRHSFASHILDGGACLRDVQELLGHKSVRATQIYTQTTQTRLQELYQRAHPGMTKPTSN
jgi:integrase/recombinase XerC